jgi:putative two-component system response regulator
MRILTVDDDPIALQLLGKALRAAGHEVETARNGIEALELLRSGDCRMVISDWNMPYLDGLELCRRIRGQDLTGYVYIILLTSHDGRQRVVEGMSAGADDFMSKPFHPAELEVRIRAGERVLSLETRDVAIFALAKLAESRDPETGAHLERVRRYSRALAEQLGTQAKFRKEIDDKYVSLIYLTSPLHDIGKVGIPDCVLLKPAKLTDQEFAVMKTHADLGARTLDAALKQYPGAKFLEIARDIAATHHERFDGNGYPSRLKGTEIPLCGRIVALADVYDALTTKRVYKDAFSHEVARDIIVKESGSHFDPEVVAAFVAREAQFLTIAQQYREDPVPDDATLLEASR